MSDDCDNLFGSVASSLVRRGLALPLPTAPEAAGGGPTGNGILTEGGDWLVTESGDYIVTE